ncbi:phosphotyrosine protein phosphatase [Chloroflexus islandicus]|uniref:protein-tyrosine-phosphatase n=1 Tax=Chloroflexus islandicus TaxID=1707952 RepID=A0A178MA62_9CHLR|nr:low molecular weight protein-tyrosine-phosphatase [Chloroflexus islandicus]OAN45433.1 phosphotyrosine protein phosphatase [Chloroflexus islandicus]
MQRKIRVLFVCMGNICRSPMAEAIFRHLVEQAGLSDRFEIDSAGTGGWHVGEPPHPGTQRVLARHNIATAGMRARQVRSADIDQFDYILVMDRENLADLGRFHPRARERAKLLLSFAPELGVDEVPDPYYNGRFDEVYQLIETACRNLLAYIREREGV